MEKKLSICLLQLLNFTVLTYISKKQELCLKSNIAQLCIS